MRRAQSTAWLLSRATWTTSGSNPRPGRLKVSPGKAVSPGRKWPLWPREAVPTLTGLTEATCPFFSQVQGKSPQAAAPSSPDPNTNRTQTCSGANASGLPTPVLSPQGREVAFKATPGVYSFASGRANLCFLDQSRKQWLPNCNRISYRNKLLNCPAREARHQVYEENRLILGLGKSHLHGPHSEMLTRALGLF